MKPEIYVGIDWARTQHTVCLLNIEGKRMGLFKVEATAKGNDVLLREIRKHKAPCVIAIEREDLPVVSFMREEGFTVLIVEPSRTRFLRDEIRKGGSKTDEIDARAIAEYARTKAHLLTERHPDMEPATVWIRKLYSHRRSMVSERSAKTFRLKDLLSRVAPGYYYAFEHIGPSATRFILRALEGKLHLRAEDIEPLARATGFNRPDSITRIKKFLCSEPVSPEMRFHMEEIRYLCEDIITLSERIKKAEKDMARAYEGHPGSELFKGIPGVNLVLGCGIISLLSRGFSSPEHLAAFSGVAPRVSRTGKGPGLVCYRKACNKQARDTLTQLARSSILWCSWAREMYHRLRKRGKRHYHALRIIARVWTRILFAVWRDNRPYNENIYLAARERQRSCLSKSSPSPGPSSSGSLSPCSTVAADPSSPSPPRATVSRHREVPGPDQPLLQVGPYSERKRSGG
ncbi:MAG: IS110 family transposase [Candidatus Hydrothermota bacterium]|nr:MAG: IS110 family transposase [Candidatus Hydrothermae bacterium]